MKYLTLLTFIGASLIGCGHIKGAKAHNIENNKSNDEDANVIPAPQVKSESQVSDDRKKVEVILTWDRIKGVQSYSVADVSGKDKIPETLRSEPDALNFVWHKSYTLKDLKNISGLKSYEVCSHQDDNAGCIKVDLCFAPLKLTNKECKFVSDFKKFSVVSNTANKVTASWEKVENVQVSLRFGNNLSNLDHVVQNMNGSIYQQTFDGRQDLMQYYQLCYELRDFGSQDMCSEKIGICVLPLVKKGNNRCGTP